jgi:hypothetical protein
VYLIFLNQKECVFKILPNLLFFLLLVKVALKIYNEFCYGVYN